MWFLLNIQSVAAIQILNIDDMDVLPSDYDQLLMKQNSNDPRFISTLNHARFYLPDIFPGLNKMVLFDHDVVVQRDLSRLWSIDMKGKVVGAVETCKEGEPSFHLMSTFINFSDAWVSGKFSPKACTWAFGMNLVDLEEWRRRKLTSTYIKYFNMVRRLYSLLHLLFSHNTVTYSCLGFASSNNFHVGSSIHLHTILSEKS